MRAASGTVEAYMLASPRPVKAVTLKYKDRMYLRYSAVQYSVHTGSVAGRVAAVQAWANAPGLAQPQGFALPRVGCAGCGQQGQRAWCACGSGCQHQRPRSPFPPSPRPLPGPLSHMPRVGD